MEAIDKIAVTTQLRAQHLDGHRAPENLVLGCVDLTDPAFAEQALQLVGAHRAGVHRTRPAPDFSIKLFRCARAGEKPARNRAIIIAGGSPERRQTICMLSPAPPEQPA